ncbi:hypothetical protein [Halapricum desulfuricans]|uniref:Uncharacterized protein n=1 Tax=Halapricum desulfuricans TaxID=2841257 RepID=A0A897N7M2_9EURY|nr:hypothetical protein [Halapricum desulfuricans]QSG08268.1 hypothetical protein HSR122_0864 [Halapricum desulfuricans]
MSNQQVDDALVKADRWSKVIALFFAMGMFGLATLLTESFQLSAVVAAFGAIGVRIYVPYHVSVWGEDSGGIASQSYELTGNYHHGAAGIALVVASFAALAALVAGPSVHEIFATGTTSAVYGALGVALAVGAVLFVLLRTALPS